MSAKDEFVEWHSAFRSGQPLPETKKEERLVTNYCKEQPYEVTLKNALKRIRSLASTKGMSEVQLYALMDTIVLEAEDALEGDGWTNCNCTVRELIDKNCWHTGLLFELEDGAQYLLDNHCIAERYTNLNTVVIRYKTVATCREDFT